MIALDPDANRVMDRLRARAQRPPHLDCVSWNEAYGVLSKRDSSLPGKWRIDRAPQMRHWLDLVSARKFGRRFMGQRDQYAHMTEQIWLIAGTQSMKTRSLLYAALGYCVDLHASPMAYVLPRLKDFKRVLDNRLKPFFEETPRLDRHFPHGKRARSSAITYQAWRLIRQTIYMLCGELADDLRSFPVCDMVFDEFDLLPLNVEKQGDPIELGLDRQKTWPRQKLAMGATTPTTVDGHGWRRLCMGSHERLLIECPTCGAHQELHPDRLRHPADATPDEIKLKRLATWQCGYCEWHMPDDGTPNTNGVKEALIANAAQAERWVPGVWAISEKRPTGLWTPSASFDAGHRLTERPPAETTIRTGHLNSLYSRFITLSEFAAHELQARLKGDPEQMIAHVNGWRCEPNIPQIVAAPEESTVARVTGTYGYALRSAPAGSHHVALILDQQGNTRASTWFAYEVRGYGDDGETWLIDCGEIQGWEAAEQFEERTFAVGSEALPVEVVGMDGSNGTMRVPLQEWAARRPKTRMLLTGRYWPDYLWQQRLASTKRERRNKRIVTGARIFNFHSNAYKSELFGRISGINGAKKWNLPDDVPQFYLNSVRTSEEQKPAKIRLPGSGQKQQVMVWEKRMMYDETGKIVMRTDNHWFDTATMALVLADVQGWNDAPVKRPRTVSAADWFARGGSR